MFTYKKLEMQIFSPKKEGKKSLENIKARCGEKNNFFSQRGKKLCKIELIYANY